MTTDQIVALYGDARQRVIDAGYGWEIEWQASCDVGKIAESEFLREAAWVVLSAGFRESVVRRYFGAISDAFLDWTDAQAIHRDIATCQERAMAVFANGRKIRAIAEIVTRVAEKGMDEIRERIHADGVQYLREFPYVGPVTAYHFAKNIGLDVVKPDRHLVRMAAASGHSSPMEMCSRVAKVVGESLCVVDLVFWRYATLTNNYEEEFRRKWMAVK